MSRESITCGHLHAFSNHFCHSKEYSKALDPLPSPPPFTPYSIPLVFLALAAGACCSAIVAASLASALWQTLSTHEPRPYTHIVTITIRDK